MVGNIGLGGVIGVVFVVAGLALIAYVDPIIAIGILSVIVGVAIVVRELITRTLSVFGLGGLG